MPVPQFCSPRGKRLVVSHPACVLSDKHRLYSEMGLHKICCMVKARLACPSGQDLGITAFWLRGTERELELLSLCPGSLLDLRLPQLVDMAAQVSQPLPSPPSGLELSHPPGSATSGLLSAPSKKLALIVLTLTDLIPCITGTTYRCH